ncbi:MAG: class I SAM-dependent methyltransferase [Pseudomonadota bacterium]|nr:class I SAM-dependent methyltransferase [Pseudomonadota bacterium]
MKPPVFNPDWPDDVLALYRHDMQEIWDRGIAPQVWNQYHNQLDLYLGLAPAQPAKILDVGCAQGTLALMLAERGHSVLAVDLRPQFLEYAKSRYTHGDVRFMSGNVLEDDIPGGHDLIFANQIIEHLVYPGEMLQRLKKLLKPGGRLVTTTPNAAYVKNDLPSYRALGDPGQWAHLQFTADADGHFFAYSAVELHELYETAGFHDVRARFFETPLINGHMKLRYLHRWMPVPVLRMFDRLTLMLPWLGRASAHQLLATGIRPLES